MSVDLLLFCIFVVGLLVPLHVHFFCYLLWLFVPLLFSIGHNFDVGVCWSHVPVVVGVVVVLITSTWVQPQQANPSPLSTSHSFETFHSVMVPCKVQQTHEGMVGPHLE